MASLTNSTNIATTNSNLNLFGCSFTVSVVEKPNSINVAGNYSYVTVTYNATCVVSGRRFSGSSRPNAGSLSITVNGTVKTIDVPFPSGATNGTVLVSDSYEQKVSHDSNGAKTITIKLKMNSGTDPYNYGVVWAATTEQSTTLALTTIKRGAIVTVFNNFTVENGISFTYQDYVSSCAQRILIKIGSTTVLTLTKTSSAGTHSESITWTTAQLNTIYSAIGPTATSGTFTLTIETTMSGTVVTNSKTAIGSLSLSANAPEIGSLEFKEVALQTYGVSDTQIVRYLSVKRITVIPTAKNGATITSVVVFDGSRSVYLTKSGNTYQTDLSNISGTNITISVGDSRGFMHGEPILELTYIPYIYPTITAVEFDRTSAIDTTGFIRPTGSYYEGTIGTTLNEVSWKYSFDGTTFTDAQNVIMSGTSWNGNESLPTDTLLRDQTYTCTVQVVDAFGQTANFKVTLGTAELSIWIGKNTVRAKYFVAEEALAVLDSDSQKIVLDESTITSVKTTEVYSSDVSLSTTSGNMISFSLPADFKRSLGCVLYRCWPASNWTNGAVVSIVFDNTFNNDGTVYLTTTNAQTYNIKIKLNYIADIAS